MNRLWIVIFFLPQVVNVLIINLCLFSNILLCINIVNAVLDYSRLKDSVGYV